MNSTELQVEGMSCGSCVKHINAALQPLAGVGEVTVDLTSGRVKVTGDTQSDVLLSALKEAGYPASVLTEDCLLYTSPSPRDLSTSRMPSSA